MARKDPLEILVSQETEIHHTIWSEEGNQIVSLCDDGIRKTEVQMGPAA